MSVSDVVSDHVQVLDDSSMTIQPSGTVCWSIQNIYIPYGVTCELYRTDGVTDILIMSVSNSILSPNTINVTNSIYFKLKNVSGGTTCLGYDGRVSHV